MKKRILLRVRTISGTTIAELAGIVFIFFFFLALPMIDLCLIGYRSSIVFGAVRDAATQASTSLTYSSPVPSLTAANNVPAVQRAQNAVQQYLHPFSGLRMSRPRVGIVVVNNTTGKKSGPFYHPLISIDDEANAYYLDVSVKAEAEPIAEYLSPIVGRIPGIAAPIVFEPHTQRRFENPRGLTM